MRATINNCKDEQILKELCSLFERGLIQKEIILSVDEAHNEEEAYNTVSKKYGISPKTAEFIFHMTFDHWFSLNYEKVNKVYHDLLGKERNAEKKQELLRKQEAIHRKIREHAVKVGLFREGDFEPIYDGIYIKDAGRYLNSNVHVMWVLKEAYDDEYDDGEPCGGGWNYFDCLEPNQTPWKIRTWRNMIYASYGIIHNVTMENMNGLDVEDMADVLLEIVCINLSKMPGHTTTEASLLAGYYETWKDILNEQIALYNPQVVIFGNTFPYFKDDLLNSGKVEHTPKDDISQVYIKDGVKYIDAYHPQSRISRAKYVDSIINNAI